ncbi:MAG: glutamate 5-kinase, partial [Oscillospiraceae bacterium]
MNEQKKPLRVVVKVGTSTLTRENGSLNLRSMEHLARTLSDLRGAGYQVILVSSGAIGIGTGKLGLATRPTELRMKQAAAAVGQCEMMHLYDKFFGDYDCKVAQIL